MIPISSLQPSKIQDCQLLFPASKLRKICFEALIMIFKFHLQLALLATYTGDPFLALYHCIRSLAVKEPFPDAWNNLMLLFEEVMSKDFLLDFILLFSSKRNLKYVISLMIFPPSAVIPFESTGLKQLFIVSCESAEQVIYFAFIFQWSSP